MGEFAKITAILPGVFAGSTAKLPTCQTDIGGPRRIRRWESRTQVIVQQSTDSLATIFLFVAAPSLSMDSGLHHISL